MYRPIKAKKKQKTQLPHKGDRKPHDVRHCLATLTCAKNNYKQRPIVTLQNLDIHHLYNCLFNTKFSWRNFPRLRRLSEFQCTCVCMQRLTD